VARLFGQKFVFVKWCLAKTGVIHGDARRPSAGGSGLLVQRFNAPSVLSPRSAASATLALKLPE